MNFGKGYVLLRRFEELYMILYYDKSRELFYILNKEMFGYIR